MSRSPLRRRLGEKVLVSLRRALPDRFGEPWRLRGIVLGFSAGADSTALLHLLADLARPRRVALVAAHLDHAIRPDSGEQARFARARAEEAGAEYQSSREDVPAFARRERRSLEDAGRVLRHDFLREVARSRGFPVVALAHTRGDQAETLLLRLARGAGPKGLGAIHPARHDGGDAAAVVRPLLAVPGEEIRTLVAAEGWSVFEDPSNADPRFARNRVRNEILPLMRARMGPGVEAALSRSAAILRDDEAWLAAAALREFSRIAEVTDGKNAGDADAKPDDLRGRTVRLPCRALSDAPPALARRIAREAFRIARGDLRRIGLAHCDDALALAGIGRGGASLDLPGVRVTVRNRILTVAPAPRGAARLPGESGEHSGHEIDDGIGEPERRSGVLPASRGNSVDDAWNPGSEGGRKPDRAPRTGGGAPRSRRSGANPGLSGL